MKRIPVVILSGFLGSGKTTLLLHLLQQAEHKGIRSGMLINEFGKMDIDGYILGGKSSSSVQTLLGGCVCCSKKSEIVACFDELLKTDSEIIFVELTGLANPEEVMIEMTKKEIISKVYLKNVVTVVDAEAYLNERYSSIGANVDRTLSKQISVADMIIVNKLDLVDGIAKNEIETRIRDVNRDAAIQFTTFSQVDLNKILSGNESKFSEVYPTPYDQTPIAEEDVQLSFDYMSTIAIPINLRVTKAFIENYLSILKPNLIRAKGFVFLEGEETPYLVQYFGTRIAWEPFAEYQSEPYLTLIGIDLNSNDAFTKLAAMANKPIDELLQVPHQYYS
ncbi:CobW family GTP-binding protein [Peribacillus saganii]|uniref:CobW family GTP-binding protein n=1 Tax=Peribacillus saganii TaxID=2303992 RepID=UPI00115CAC33|nr:GTP-binding protein [Peribacillus saganii]